MSTHRRRGRDREREREKASVSFLVLLRPQFVTCGVNYGARVRVASHIDLKDQIKEDRIVML